VLIWLALSLTLLAIVLTHVPAVQRYLGNTVGHSLSQKLGTEVKVGRVDLGFLNRIIIDDVHIIDQRKKPMLDASRLSMKYSLSDLSQGVFTISSAQLFGVKLNIYKDSANATANYQFALDSLASKDDDNGDSPDIRIKSLIIRNGSVSYNQYDVAPTPGLLNMAHLRIDSISSHIVIRQLGEDSLKATVKKLSLKEQSGLNINQLKFDIRANRREANVEQLILEMPRTHLQLADVKANYNLTDSGLDLKKLHYEGRIEPTQISTNDLAFLSRKLRSIDETASLSTRFSGTATSANASDIELRTSNGVELHGNATVADWDERLRWTFHSDKLNVPMTAVGQFAELPEVMKQLGNVSFEGDAHGEGRAVGIDGLLTTDIGSADIVGEADEQQNFTAKLSADNFAIDKLTNQGDLGILSGEIEANGHWKDHIEARGNIRQMAYKGYIYNNVSIDAAYKNDAAKATVNIDDPNVVLRLDASAKSLSAVPEATIDASVRQLSPAALRLTDKWGNARIGADINGTVSGKSLKDLSGDLTVSNFSKNTQDTIYRIPWLRITANGGNTIRQYSLSSDFANATIDGHDGRYDIDARVTDLEWVHQLIGPNLNLPLPLTVRGTANDSLKNTELTIATPKFEINGDLSLTKNIAGQQVAHLKVRPSNVLVEEAKWNIEPAEITYFDKHLDVGHFAIRHGDQYLAINGTASASPNDTLDVELKQVDVKYILDLVKFHSVRFDGLATGKATITNAFTKPDAHADLTVSNFLFQEGRMGTLNAKVDWNREQEQIDIHATADDAPEGMTFIDGYVSPKRNYIDLAITARGTRTEFVESFTSSFLSNFDGNADGQVRLAGDLSEINLTGQLVVNATALMRPLNCVYKLVNDTIRLIPDEIEFRRIPIYDTNNHIAYLNGGLHHKHLTRLTYDFDVEAQNFLCYDFREFGENTFYGTVYGTGNVDIHGRPGNLTINADMTPDEGTTFVYNAANPDAITKQEFISWNKPKKDTVNAEKPKSDSDIPTDIYLNFLVNCNPNATIRLLMDNSTGDYITLKGNGTLNATYYNKGAFNIFGTYIASEGTYGITIQQLIKKNFTFNDGGTIVFGGNPYDAQLNLQAVNTVSGVSLSDLGIGNSFSNNTVRVNCLMNITGQPRAPKVDFDIELPTVNATEQQMVRSIINGEEEMNQQVLYLLGVGRFYTQGINNAQANTQNSQTSLAMQSLLSGTISSQINDVLNKVINNNNWNFGANIATGNDGWNNAEYEGILTGRLLDNRLLINGQFGYRDRATAVGTGSEDNFIGDFDIRYLLYPSGNLALKVYNQTNDRYFTRSSLTTQGVGLIMKKDFNSLKDIFRKKK